MILKWCCLNTICVWTTNWQIFRCLNLMLWSFQISNMYICVTKCFALYFEWLVIFVMYYKGLWYLYFNSKTAKLSFFFLYSFVIFFCLSLQCHVLGVFIDIISFSHVQIFQILVIQIHMTHTQNLRLHSCLQKKIKFVSHILRLWKGGC